MGVVVVVVLVPALLTSKIISSVRWSKWTEFYELLALCFHFAAEIPQTTTLAELSSSESLEAVFVWFYAVKSQHYLNSRTLCATLQVCSCCVRSQHCLHVRCSASVPRH